MAEGRMLKKQISISKKLTLLKSDSARLLYTWLIPHLDVEGRFSADPAVVKGQIVPRLKMTKKKVWEYLQDMAQNELIILYEDDGDYYLEFTVFEKHQNIRKDREAGSKIPPPDLATWTYPGELQDDSRISKDKISKDKVEKTSLYGKEFEKLWQQWPQEGRFKKKYCRIKFYALCKQGKLDLFKKVTYGYSEYLEAQCKKKNFNQQVMHLSTWLNNWEEEREQYEDFKYEPPL